jgi:hypothetical protein
MKPENEGSTMVLGIDLAVVVFISRAMLFHTNIKLPMRYLESSLFSRI